MRFVIRHDIGGWATGLPAFTGLESIEIEKPFLFLTGSNGCGKSSLLAMLRRTIGLTGLGTGRFPKYQGACDDPWTPGWREEMDLGKRVAMIEERGSRYFEERKGRLCAGVPGVLDVQALGWTGQRCYLHDTRGIDISVGDRYGNGMDLMHMSRSSKSKRKSHGEQMNGRMRYALAWALGRIDVPDAYDHKLRKADSGYDADRHARPFHDVYQAVAGGPPSAGRPVERWILLDEPENGVAPDRLAEHLAVLLEHAAPGRLRVICATHSPLVEAGFGVHPSAQVVDLADRSAAMERARHIATSAEACSAAAQAAVTALEADIERTRQRDKAALKECGRGREHVALPMHDAQEIPLGTDHEAEEQGPEPYDEA